MAETLKLLANSFYGYQIIDRSPHTVTKYLSDEKTEGAINNKIFECLSYVNDQLYEMELVNSQIEQKPPKIVEFFCPAICKIENARAVS